MNEEDNIKESTYGKTYVVSARNQFERVNKKLINQRYFTLCGKCRGTVKQIRDRIKKHGQLHYAIFGFYCQTCKIFYINDKTISAVYYNFLTE